MHAALRILGEELAWLEIAEGRLIDDFANQAIPTGLVEQQLQAVKSEMIDIKFVLDLLSCLDAEEPVMDFTGRPAAGGSGMRACAVCYYFVGPRDGAEGDCHLVPPVVFLVHDGEGEAVFHSILPTVGSQGFCRDFSHHMKAKAEPEPEV